MLEKLTDNQKQENRLAYEYIFEILNFYAPILPLENGRSDWYIF